MGSGKLPSVSFGAILFQEVDSEALHPFTLSVIAEEPSSLSVSLLVDVFVKPFFREIDERAFSVQSIDHKQSVVGCDHAILVHIQFET